MFNNYGSSTTADRFTMGKYGTVPPSRQSKASIKVQEYEIFMMETGEQLYIHREVAAMHAADGKVADWKLKWSLTKSLTTKKQYERYLKVPGAYENALASSRDNINTLQKCKNVVVKILGKEALKLSEYDIVEMLLNNQENNDDMSISNTTITENTVLSGSLYTPSTSSGDEMDIDSESEYSESDVSSYHPQREVKNMAKKFGYDDETSSFGSSIMTVEMEDVSEYSESEEEMEVGF
jgi:hypothetical protein